MKKFLKVIWGIFAVIGILFVAYYIGLRLTYGRFYISIYPKYEARHDEFVDLLRLSGPYKKDATPIEMKVLQDSVRAEEIRDYFQLDQLYDADADTWTKALAIGKFVASNIPHDNQEIEPEHRNAIDLWEYTKNVAPAFNCRLHSILTFELMLAAGLHARYVTCLPEDRYDTDCHVVNEVWLPELGKWAMIDSDMDGNYASDLDGTPLSLREIREHYISGEKMQYHPRFKKGTTKMSEYYAYMAKNTYWFSCWETLSYYQEDMENRKREAGRNINLVPSGFEAFHILDGGWDTTDADSFWAAPVKTSL
ncbi:MAG: transglutaminase domain-containing protein [Bacteroidales bacterium]|nr:transglutaminase domain-containing protein [Bacteroidales bacterium]